MPQLAIVGVALVSVLLLANPLSAAGQRRSRTAAGQECQPLADQIQQLEQKYDEVRKLYYQALGESMDLIRQNIDDQALIAEMNRMTPTPERAAQVKKIQERIASREGPIKEHSDRATDLGRQGSAIRLEIIGLSVDLDLCNFGCGVLEERVGKVGRVQRRVGSRGEAAGR
jgi:outer membrane murein-binding lipoprotein Lpp